MTDGSITKYQIAIILAAIALALIIALRNRLNRIDKKTKSMEEIARLIEEAQASGSYLLSNDSVAPEYTKLIITEILLAITVEKAGVEVFKQMLRTRAEGNYPRNLMIDMAIMRQKYAPTLDFLDNFFVRAAHLLWIQNGSANVSKINSRDEAAKLVAVTIERLGAPTRAFQNMQQDLRRFAGSAAE